MNGGIIPLILFLVGFILLIYRIRLWTGGKLSLSAIPTLKINWNWIFGVIIVIALAALVIIIGGKISPLENFTQQTTPTVAGRAPSCNQPLPFQRISGCVRKVSQTEAEIRMNGSEGLIDSGLTLRTNEMLKIEQIIFADPKRNRLTYNWCGDYFPIWGGGAPAPNQKLRFPLPSSGNGVIVVLQNNNYDSPIPFPAGKTAMETGGPGRVYLYYNAVTEWIDASGVRQQNDGSQTGWDGSTATFRLAVAQ